MRELEKKEGLDNLGVEGGTVNQQKSNSFYPLQTANEKLLDRHLVNSETDNRQRHNLENSKRLLIIAATPALKG